MLLIFIIYMLATKGSAQTFHFLAFMMAMGNTYGVVLIILLMGNGLVALPRRLWRKGNSQYELTRLYVMVRLFSIVEVKRCRLYLLNPLSMMLDSN